ncbi:hypothetical protein C8T65DRAFT_700525 [Cerioporus squamosus]|nr:hypothetical protein C8T65DRAFT_700525 [Cerioporus squamosus]
MSERRVPYCTAEVRRVAAGVDDNPDTFILVNKPASLISAGVRLALYTRVVNTYTHVGWMVVERARVVDKHEVEFVLCRVGHSSDELRGERHFLIVDKLMAATGWSLRNLVPRLAAAWKWATSREETIVRVIPPTPSPSTSSFRSLSPIFATISPSSAASNASCSGTISTALSGGPWDEEEHDSLVVEASPRMVRASCVEL